ncbi:hypothetical protein H7I57_23720, partial [Mycobacterium pyrenivorans]|nr:hypothetical protein [Mycolicibacterium pyrenivorans]
RTPSGTWRRMVDAALGRDKDTDSSIAYYRDLAAQMVAALPAVFFPKPATVEQIWWHWNYIASRGAWDAPLPTQPFNPDATLPIWWHWNYIASRGAWDAPLPTQPFNPDATLPGSAFTPVHLDPGAAQLRDRRWRAARTDADVFVRTFRDRTDGVADSYQALLPLDSFPDNGIAWPRSTLFKVLDDLTTPTTVLDWTINITFTSADVAVSTAENVIVNIRDQ